ncbi:hypothetical protein Syun_011864 [Stephania yunnanensis]|uniref:Uncharacterized protein n=1 Tax=Stephania yunnanensis TaxID=152371 RepID=A0AAP0PGX9_9MAGN
MGEAVARDRVRVPAVERRCGGALSGKRSSTRHQQWTRRRDFDKARRRKGLLAKETRGVGLVVHWQVSHGIVYLRYELLPGCPLISPN